MSLPRLAKRETGALASNVTAGKALPSDLLDQKSSRRTDGIPLFVEELTKSLIESGVLREDSGGYALDGPLPQMAIPASLQTFASGAARPLCAVEGGGADRRRART